MSTYGYGNDSAGSTHARQYPLSYIFSGHYLWSDGGLGSQTITGHWWTATTNNNVEAELMAMNSGSLNSQYYYTKNYGFTLVY